MIVDVHAHTPTHRDAVPDGEARAFTSWRTDRAVVTTNTWADFDSAMSDADVAIVFNIAVADPAGTTGIPHDPERTNDATAEFVANDPARRIGFMSVDPTAPDCFEEAERCRELGLVGVKLGPNYQNFDPLGAPARAFYAYCERNALPILFHQGASPIRAAPLRYTYPLVTDEVALSFPELRIVMAHMGHPWGKETVATIRKHPHVYADVSSIYLRPWVCYESLLAAVEWGCTHKLLLGSDFPIANTGEAMAGLRGVNTILEGTALPRVPSELIEQIIHADALSALGLTVGEPVDR
ncbi:amidohydrolase family protein [Nonomuraea phyllanthi]|uniref:Amidohydrolase family protein n=1 Tax=Nonomuraea phyllanthi TaxID=2219224 RepID=A0A5C4WK03_9ACTN|nr:amidohydrolase family protein [Nonomuraea phyllanthi]KAB8194193.1 amidohydrolase family protein [Nonomuraea phyllanthi]QFY07793.1 amidohydrolase family protein [Nonomuraea phyllanthi]